MNKSANQLWKESGTTLPFKQWIEREKQKFNYKSETNQFVGANGLSLDTSGLSLNSKSSSNPKTVFGLNSKTLIISGAIILVAAGIYIYKRNKK
jgi:hypothetical protein